MRGIRPVISSLLALAILVPAPYAWASCDCDGHPFASSRTAVFGRDATVLCSILVNEDRGRLKIGAGAFMPSTSNLMSYSVQVGAEASVGSVNATLVRFHPTSTVGGPVVGPLAVPVQSPFCSIPPIDCGGDDVLVRVDQGSVTLSPGSYGNVKIGGAALVRLLPGHYQICDLRISHSGAVIADGPVTIDVLGNLRAASSSIVVPATGQPRIVFNVAGSKVLFGNGAVVRAEVAAPNARLKVGQQGAFDGCFCTRDAKVGLTATVGCTPGSPSGAFLDRP